MCEVTQSCSILFDPVDSSSPDSYVHGILQARILEWVATSFSRGSSWPRDWTCISCVGYDNLDSVLKSITLPTKVYIVKAIVFLVVMCGYESWTIKKAEHWRTDALEVWCWRKLFKVPWITRRSNQSILKEISPEYSLEGLMLKLKLQHFGHLMQRGDSLEGLWCWGR